MRTCQRVVDGNSSVPHHVSSGLDSILHLLQRGGDNRRSQQGSPRCSSLTCADPDNPLPPNGASEVPPTDSLTHRHTSPGMACSGAPSRTCSNGLAASILLRACMACITSVKVGSRSWRSSRKCSGSGSSCPSRRGTLPYVTSQGLHKQTRSFGLYSGPSHNAQCWWLVKQPPTLIATCRHKLPMCFAAYVCMQGCKGSVHKRGATRTRDCTCC
jgi:hypothetical protein